MDFPQIDFVESKDTSIPVPSPDYLKSFQKNNVPTVPKPQEEFTKHARAYDAFCRWVALPKAQRNPVTAVAFEKRWKLPQGYTGKFKEREDFKGRVVQYHFDWLMDNWPDVMEAIYKRAVKNSSSDAKIYAEIIAKQLDLEKPKATVQPFILMGVSQDKIDALFVPRAYEKIPSLGVTPDAEKE